MNNLEWLEQGDFLVRIDGLDYCLPDPRDLDYQTLLALLESGDVLSRVTPDSVPEWKRELVFRKWRARWDLPTFEMAHHLTYLVDHFRGEITNDLLVHTGLNLGEMWRERRWQTLLDVIVNFPQGSPSSAALAADEDHAKMLAESILAREERDRKEGREPKTDEERSLLGWTPEMGMLADLIDVGQLIQYVLIAANSEGHPKMPDPYPRPKSQLATALENARYNQRKAKHESLASRLLGRKSS